MRRLLGLLVVVAAFFLLFGPVLWPEGSAEDREVRYGITYSTIYAEYLGLDPVADFERIVGDLGVDLVRIPVYWNRIEPGNNVYDFAELDALMRIAASNDVDVILAIGRKVPRWPECYIPTWAADGGDDRGYRLDLSREQLEMMEQVVLRYKDDAALVRWQVENEPYFKYFGECPRVDRYLLRLEFALVRSLDPDTPIQTTASGEQSLWMRASDHADIVGVSLYRTTHTPGIGHITYPIPRWTYRAKAALFAKEDRVVVSELQAEPWLPTSVHEMTIEEQLDIFDAETFAEHVAYAERVGFDEVLLWGAEWWYFLQEQGESSLVEAARVLFDPAS